MPTIKAVFLAAGRGVRMGERGLLTPKGLISLGTQSFLEDAVDPRLGQAGASGVVNSNKLGIVPELGESRFDRVGSFLAPFSPTHSQQREVGGELVEKLLAVFRRDDDDDLRDIVTVAKLLR